MDMRHCPIDIDPDDSPDKQHDWMTNRYGFCDECVMITWGGGVNWSGCKHNTAGLAAFAERAGVSL